ncbi:MAG TPA: type II toxin-antitoxin system RelE/ParE family toxin [Pirellulales bacterium]|nr:type II toxin-antitoxin system RelE/ParE family toxin [Pirellulales bacterium]
MAALIVTPEALAQADELPAKIVARMERIFDRLRRWPDVSGAKPLRGALAGPWRIRTGDYRVQFHIRHGRPATPDAPAVPDTVVVEKIGHRDGFYDDDDA